MFRRRPRHETIFSITSQAQEIPKIRKTILALSATAALGIAALIPTTASAWHGHHFRGFGGFGITIGGPVYGSCWQYRYVETRRGLRRMMVNVCGY